MRRCGKLKGEIYDNSRKHSHGLLFPFFSSLFSDVISAYILFDNHDGAVAYGRAVKFSAWLFVCLYSALWLASIHVVLDSRVCIVLDFTSKYDVA